MPSAVDLARFRRRQLLRIVLRDVLGIATLSDVTEELSNLADAILDVAYRRIRAEFVARHGEPRLPDGRPCGFSVISLGKLGGKELNYSSDIDLMFVYGGNGETDGPIAGHQQGVLQEGRQPVHRAALHLHRAKASATAWTCACGPTARWARSAFPQDGARSLLQRAGARLGKADADQGAGLGGRDASRARRCWNSWSR